MVSIIVPVYKVEKYLRPCVDSILAQTYRDIQVILIDDGSPDNCGAICDEYAQKDSRVLALHKPNGGVSSARNFGLEYVSGDFVTFCDGDDGYLPDWVEQLVAAIRKENADVVLGCFAKVYDDGTIVSEDPHETGVWQTPLEKSRIQYCFEMVMSQRHGWEITTRLFRTDIILKNKIRFCETCANYAEDLGFVLTYSLFASRIVSIDCTGYLYNIRSNSMMQTSVSKPKLESLHQVFLFTEAVLRDVLASDMAQRVLPWFYLQMIGQQFMSKLWSSGMEPEDLRKAAIANVADWKCMAQDISRILEERKYWNSYYPASYNLELANHMHFLLSGSWLKLRIQCKMIRMFRPIIDWVGKWLMADL